jgi:hypothetical protein
MTSWPASSIGSGLQRQGEAHLVSGGTHSCKLVVNPQITPEKSAHAACRVAPELRLVPDAALDWDCLAASVQLLVSLEAQDHEARLNLRRNTQCASLYRQAAHFLLPLKSSVPLALKACLPACPNMRADNEQVCVVDWQPCTHDRASVCTVESCNVV